MTAPSTPPTSTSTKRRQLVVRNLQRHATASRPVAIIALLVCFGLAHAQAPKQTTVLGLALGATPQKAEAVFSAHYKTCNVVRSIYHAMPDDSTPVTAALAINPGLTANDIG